MFSNSGQGGIFNLAMQSYAFLFRLKPHCIQWGLLPGRCVQEGVPTVLRPVGTFRILRKCPEHQSQNGCHGACSMTQNGCHILKSRKGDRATKMCSHAPPSAIPINGKMATTSVATALAHRGTHGYHISEFWDGDRSKIFTWTSSSSEDFNLGLPSSMNDFTLFGHRPA